MAKLTTPETRASRAHHVRDAADCPTCGGWGVILLTGGANLGRPAWGPCPRCGAIGEADTIIGEANDKG